MSGTEIAALRLALGCLRHYTHPDEAADAIRDALAALALPTWAGHRPLYAALTVVESRLGYDHDARLVRARLALYLCAVLRAESGRRGSVYPLGPIWHCSCPVRSRHPGWGERRGAKGIRPCERCSWCGAAPPPGAARITPLWQAPGVRGAR